MLHQEALRSDILMVDFAALPTTGAMNKAFNVYYGRKNAQEIFGDRNSRPLLDYPEHLTRGEFPAPSFPKALSGRPGFFLFSPNEINHHSLHVIAHLSPFDPPEAEQRGASDLPQRYAQDAALIDRLADIALRRYKKRLPSAGLEEPELLARDSQGLVHVGHGRWIKPFYEEGPGEFTRALLQALRWTVSLKKGDRLLDLGAGEGSILIGIADRLDKAVGVEKDRRTAKRAKENLTRNPQLIPKVEIVEGDFFGFLSKENNRSFDWIVANPPQLSPWISLTTASGIWRASSRPVVIFKT